MAAPAKGTNADAVMLDLLAKDGVIANLRASSKKQVLQELARHAAAVVGQGQRSVFDVLLERERLGTTGVGRGIAIPHGKLSNLDRVYGLFAKLAAPIDFDAVDERPVDLVFVLLAPVAAGADHLKALARISRILRDDALCEKLRKSDTSEALLAVLTEGERAHAA